MMHTGDSQNSNRRWVLQLVDQLIAYEEGQLTEDQEIAFFEHLVETGICWQLQGHYQRVAATLMDAGLISSPVHTQADTTSKTGSLITQ
jgi:hypothetical protein